jgi:DNA-binding NarL/FixJ family response regulator
MTVVVGVDGAGRSHRLDQLASAATGPVVRVAGSAGPAAELVELLAAAHRDGALVLVDDAHRLGPAELRALAAAARQGVAMAIARRPTIERPELAELDELVARQGPVELLEPLDQVGVGAVIAAVTGRPASLDAVDPVRRESAGLPAIAAVVAGGDHNRVPPALVARMQQKLAGLAPGTAELARTVALGLALTDDVLAAAAGLDPAGLAPAMRTLRDAGMLVPGEERMVPAVARAVLADLPPAGRRRLHDAVARALVAAGGDPVAAAGQLSAARARTPGAAEVYRAAAERLRFADPAAALAWFDDALDAGADPGSVAAGRAEVAALLGRPVDLDGPPAPPDAAHRLALVTGAVAAHQGRAGRAAEALLTAAPPGPVLAAPALLAAGQRDQARAAAAGDGPLPLRRLATAVVAAGADPVAAVPLLIEAAEAIEAAPPVVVLPDTPHALGALVAVTAGDAAVAEHLLDRAIATGVGGPVADDRHRLLLAWVRLRTGRYETALAELRRLAGGPGGGPPGAALPGRERLLAAALSAGIARRSGDIARLREAWSDAEPVLARQAVDLFGLEPVEELLVAAARLRHQQRMAPVLDALDRVVDRLGRPAAWEAALAWVRLQVAVAVEDVRAGTAAAERLAAAVPAGPAGAPRQRAQAVAAGLWCRALAGQVDPDRVLAAAENLAAGQLPWEASRLVGHAAIRTADAGAARRLLERARELADPEPPTAASRPGPSSGGLSEREVEVARLVLEGRTYREIGAQLYLAPKTVEHHVARIRGKLGATSRADLVAALRRVLDDSGQ